MKGISNPNAKQHLFKKSTWSTDGKKCNCAPLPSFLPLFSLIWDIKFCGHGWKWY